jgi:hypothetical protein
MNIQAVRTAPRSPWQNAYVERVIYPVTSGRQCRVRRSQLLSSYAAFRERPHSPQLESSHPEGTTGVADH